MISHRCLDRPLRVAFVGAGRMARNHLAAIQRLACPVAVVGVTDRVRPAAEQFGSLAGIHPSLSVGALLEETRPDIVHVCAPPAAHFDAAHAALDWGAHVYVEKPFALTTDAARELIALARVRRRLVCAGHQLLRDRAFEALTARLPELETAVQIDSHFAFRPVHVSAGVRALADLAIDVLPHPLYTLIDVLTRCAGRDAHIEVASAIAGSSDLQAVLRAGNITGRLSVSLRARPVASSLTVTGTAGSLTCDFVRSTLIGTANSGTEVLEKILNPMIEGSQLISRTAASLGRRVRSGESYPGLQPLIDAFYRAIMRSEPSPIAPEHLMQVTAVFEQLVAKIEEAAAPASVRAGHVLVKRGPRVVVTGAGGFLGSEIARSLRGVRGIGRGTRPDNPHVAEWVSADLSDGLAADALTGSEVVVHAAAETAGDYQAHRRNSLDATRHLLRAMRGAGVRKLVLVSSLSVLRPPRWPWEIQDETTPRSDDSRRFGPYVWGKSIQEEIVERDAPQLGIAVRIIRPGALLDWRGVPGIMGRHLYGAWHLGLGRPALPIAVCDVAKCADAIAWCATHFEDAPAVVNLFDPALVTRGGFLAELRRHGWRGRMVWAPISVISIGIMTARTLVSLARGRMPERLAAWSILRSRRYDSRLARRLLDSAEQHQGEHVAIGASSLRGASPLGLPDTLARGAPPAPLRSRGLTRALVRHRQTES